MALGFPAFPCVENIFNLNNYTWVGPHVLGHLPPRKPLPALSWNLHVNYYYPHRYINPLDLNVVIHK